MQRYDNVGLFWEDVPITKSKGSNQPRPRPPVPDTGWTCPTELPRLADAKMIAVDVETCDVGLQNNAGPGEFLDDSYTCGLAIATQDGHKWYFPTKHDGGGNLDHDMVMRWAKDELTRPHQPKIGANLQYDMGFLAMEGVHMKGQVFDVQLAEPLLDEHAYSYALGTLAKKHLNSGKTESKLYEWLAAAYGGPATRLKQAGRIHLAPAALVGPYAESDVTLPFEIFEKQKALLEAQQLWDLFMLESRLVPMLHAMRQRGVRVDLDKAEKLNRVLLGRIERDQDRLNKMAGFNVNADANDDLVRVFEKNGLDYPTTAKGNPSFTGDFLKHHTHPVTDLVIDVRKWAKFNGTFVQGYILGKNVNGRIHCSFHQLRSDTNGTVSGRFSSSNPNLQNIPARDKELGPLVRSLFIPEEGCVWEKDDYSQIEYRLMLHYAEGPEAEVARQLFHNNPKTDYHALVAKMASMERKPAKNLNFGVIYGLGIDAMMQQYGWSRDQANAFIDLYHEKIPYAKPLMEATMRAAERRGCIKTLMGRTCRFTKWEPARRGQKKYTALALAEAELKWPEQRLKRGFCYAALNRLLQGGAADIMKKAMVDVWESGVCDEIGAPHLTVHDELDWSRPPEYDMSRVHSLMENCVKLKLPIKVDAEVGPSWGQVQ